MPSTCATTTGRRPPTRPSCRSTRTPRTSSPRSTGSGRRPWPSATGWAACWPSRPPSGSPSRGSSSSARSCRATCVPPARAFELREVPEVYGRSVIGWETLPEKLLRDDRDLTLADVLRIQHLLGQKPHESGAARRQMLAGVPVDRRVVAEVPRLVIGGGLDRAVTPRRRRAARRAGWARSSSRSGRTRTSGWSSARTATSRSPRRSARSWRPTGCSGRGVARSGSLVSCRPARRRDRRLLGAAFV